MSVFESTATINKPVNEVYNFLNDMNNHEQLMPDNISGWSSTKDDAKFAIQNMGNLALKVSSRIENKEIVIIPVEKAPFNVELRWNVMDNGNGTTQAVCKITAELNMMLKMVASGPLKKLAEHQVQKLKQL